MYSNYEIEKLDDGRYAAYTLLDYNEYGIDSNIMLCDGNSEEEVKAKLELMDKAYENGIIVGRNEEKKRLGELLGLEI